MVEIRPLGGEEARHYKGDLAAVLVDCVEGGASVGFMLPFSKQAAEQFFAGVIDEVQAGRRVLLAAFLGLKLIGTVQVVFATMPNQPHRADLAKLLVLQSARGQGAAKQLMATAEASARRAGKTLLVLDTCTGGHAEKLYLTLGWTKAGVIPKYALFPDGTWCNTAVFWKSLDHLSLNQVDLQT